MQVQFSNPMNFGKIFVTQDSDSKELLCRHTAYGIADGSVKEFKEKYRLANLSDRFDIKIDENGSTVIDKDTNKKTSFSTEDFKDYPNVLFHLLNVAINYVLIKESNTFETDGNSKKIR